ncbi:MAG: AAA family ATPase [Planctomycetota bacterium]
MTAGALLAELQDPSCFPHGAAQVQILQTHLSVVCLAGDLVYKLKKAITLPFVDFATLPARRATCRDEVRLNRRLCPDTYLGTASLRRQHGALRFAATGDDEGPDDLDVAVVMRRLPADRMLDELVRHHRVTLAEIEQLAHHIATFHASTERGPEVLAAGDPTKLATFAAANFTELRALPDHGLPTHLIDHLATASAAAFRRILPTLQPRAKTGRVVDGHGDLHARNVCMTNPPTVYDCIEFKAAFRCGDVATENAFLAMDLRYRGTPQLATAYVNAYITASGDTQIRDLLPTLCSYRAMVRAKVAALAANEPELPAADRDEARLSAHRHLLLAAAFAIEAQEPCWIAVCGPPASGKSHLCAALADATHWPHINTDIVRKHLAGLAPTQHARAEHYTPQFSQRTYAEVLARATSATRDGATVVLLDGNYPTPSHRAEAATAARAVGAKLVVAFVDIDAATAAARALKRKQDAANVSDAGPEQIAELRARFVPPTAAEGLRILRLDGARPSSELVVELMSGVLAGAE